MFELARATLLMSVFFVMTLQGNSSFGYISCSTYNIGDDIQSIAAQSLLPPDSIPIDREYVALFENSKPIDTIINGWYIYTKDYHWFSDRLTPPEKSWPPSDSINPLFISVHFTDNILPTIMTEEGIAYMRRHGPVGARDLFTLESLQKYSIPAYFSGCLTLTLENDKTEREDVIYVVDLDEECLDFVKARTSSRVEAVNHMISDEISSDPIARRQYAEEVLNKYKTAKCVVTSRLHAFLPCLAFKTPVLLINIAGDQYRFAGLKELGYNCSYSELINEDVYYDFDNPLPNPKHYYSIRKNLIKTVKNWIEEKRKKHKSL